MDQQTQTPDQPRQPINEALEQPAVGQVIIPQSQPQPMQQGQQIQPTPTYQQPAPMPQTYTPVQPLSVSDSEGSNTPAPSVQQPVYGSANTPATKRRILRAGKPLFMVIALAIVAGIGWFAFQYFAGYSTKTLTNGSYQYKLSFSSNARTITAGGNNYLEGKTLHGTNTLLVLGKPTTDGFITDCASVGKTWTSSFTISAGGSSYIVCASDDKTTYMTILPHIADDSHHLLEVFSKDKKTAVKQTVAKTIITSAEISQP